MSSETRDPRGAVLDAIIDEALDEYGEHDAYICKLDDLLARLDAADPLRKLWPEVVEALERYFRLLRRYDAPNDWHARGRTKATLDLLTRARALTPEGDDQ